MAKDINLYWQYLHGFTISSHDTPKHMCDILMVGSRTDLSKDWTKRWKIEYKLGKKIQKGTKDKERIAPSRESRPEIRHNWINGRASQRAAKIHKALIYHKG